MTVQELIQILDTFDKNQEVYLISTDHVYNQSLEPVKSIEIEPIEDNHPSMYGDTEKLIIRY